MITQITQFRRKTCAEPKMKENVEKIYDASKKSHTAFSVGGDAEDKGKQLCQVTRWATTSIYWQPQSILSVLLLGFIVGSILVRQPIIWVLYFS